MVHNTLESSCQNLSEELIEKIAERAAEKAVIKMEAELYQKLEEKIYIEAGKILLPKILKLLGILLIGSLAYFNKDFVKVL